MYEALVLIVTKIYIYSLWEIKPQKYAMKQKTNGYCFLGNNLVVDAINCI